MEKWMKFQHFHGKKMRKFQIFFGKNYRNLRIFFGKSEGFPRFSWENWENPKKEEKNWDPGEFSREFWGSRIFFFPNKTKISFLWILGIFFPNSPWNFQLLCSHKIPNCGNSWNFFSLIFWNPQNLFIPKFSSFEGILPKIPENWKIQDKSMNLGSLWILDGKIGMLGEKKNWIFNTKNPKNWDQLPKKIPAGKKRSWKFRIFWEFWAFFPTFSENFFWELDGKIQRNFFILPILNFLDSGWE